MKYIDADLLRKEIEKHRQAIRVLNEHTAPEQMSKTCAIFQYSDSILSALNSFLDTLSEEPDKSLVGEIIDWAGKFNPAIREEIQSTAYHFADWQKEQMLKDAYVESQIVEDGRIELEGDPLPCLNPIILLPYPQFNPGDKVRIVVLKEEEE